MGYWERRQEENYRAGEMKINQYFTRLEKAFNQAKRELQKTVESFYWRYAEENELTYAEAQKRLDKAEIKGLREFVNLSMQNIGKYNQDVNNMSIKARMTRYQALEAQVDAILRQLYAVDYQANAEKTMQEIYGDTYYRTWYGIDQYHGFHAEFAQVDPGTVDALLKYPFNGANFSDRLWKQKDHLQTQLMESLTTMMIQGTPPQNLVDAFAKKMNSKKRDAYRLLHTESSYLMSEATHAGYKEDGVEKYQILATLDSKTCGICGKLDGKIYPVAEAVAGKNMPPFHPFCRCTDVPYYPDTPTEGMKRAARDKDGNNIEVPESMTYEEWKKKYLNAGLQPVVTPQEEAANGQIELLKKYGNLTNIMFTGTAEDMTRWSELQKISGKTEKELLSEMSKSADNWESILKMQSETTMKPFVNQLLEAATDTELGALRTWSGGSYVNINRYLRYGINVDPISKKAAKDIEAVLGKVTTQKEIIVKRGTGTREIFEKMTGDWKKDPSVLVGQKFSDKGFTATSPMKEGGFSGAGKGNAELFIRVPKGTHGAYIAHEAFNEEEKEFLLQRGYSYRIIKAEYRVNPRIPEDKDLKVWCEVISNE